MTNVRLSVTSFFPLALLAAVACSSSNNDETGGSSDGGSGRTGASATSGANGDTDATVVTTGGSGNGSTGGSGGGSGSGDGTTGGSGGSDGSTGGPPMACAKGTDCPLSGICNPSGSCAAPTCNDGVKNQNETDIDCGGMCPACGVLKKCGAPADCTSGVCTGSSCMAPTNTDGVKNGNETGVDCGGMGNPKCGNAMGCSTADDCTSDFCSGGMCSASVCNDHVKNGTETDVDCGGSACPRCPDTDTCAVAADCTDGVCKDTGTGLRCQAPSYSDQIKNGNETDVDCGGSGSATSHGCPPADACLVDTDCASDGCDYTKHCAIHRSCTGKSTGARYGADTCGPGGAGGVGAASWESCCATVDVTASEGSPAVNTTVHLDKYQVTAGRMRAFLESVGGNVAGFIASARTAGQIPTLPVPSSTNPTGLTLMPPAWDKYLPTSMTGDKNETPDCDQSGWDTDNFVCKSGTTYAPMYTAAQNHVGPTVFKGNTQVLQGCEYTSPGTHTYYLGNPDYLGAAPDFDQTVYDTKPVQCVDYLVAQAFCIWDGGRLETTEEWLAAYGAGAMPWSTSTAMTSRGIAISSVVPKSDLPAATDNVNYAACTVANAATVCAGGAASCKNGTCQPPATYTACRFPTATDLILHTTNPGGCPAWTIPDSTHSIEVADYQYNYEYPTLKNNDFAVFIAAPGRTLGRAMMSGGQADLIGDLFEVSSNVLNYADSPLPTKAAPNGSQASWSGNGSWEVHDYVKKANGNYGILDKYGKMGLRCVHF